MVEKSTYISCKDHLVSGEEFDIKQTSIDGILKTTPVPSPDKIGRYYESQSYISHTDSKENSIDKIYQFVKNYSIRKKYKNILQLKKDTKNLLDIGSGTGDFLSAAKQYNISSLGTEPNEHARKLSKEKGNTVVENLDQLSNKEFDVITLWHVLEHVYDPKAYLQKINELLNQDGLLLIAVPNYKSYDSNYYKSNWAAFDVPRHLWHFSRTGMKNLLEEQDFKIIKYNSMPFDSFYVSLLSEQIKSGKKNMFKAFFIGLLSNLKAITSKEYSSILYIVQKNTK